MRLFATCTFAIVLCLPALAAGQDLDAFDDLSSLSQATDCPMADRCPGFDVCSNEDACLVEDDCLADKIEHALAAAEHLEAAGMDQVAQEVLQQVEGLRRELLEQKIDELAELQEEIAELRRATGRKCENWAWPFPASRPVM